MYYSKFSRIRTEKENNFGREENPVLFVFVQMGIKIQRINF